MGDRLTAMDVEGQGFRTKLRGYDPEQVRMYLRAVAEEIERLNLEDASMREDLGRMKEKLEEFRDRERALQETLVTAQRMAEEYKEKSRTESDLLIKEARIKAEKILDQAQEQLSRIESESSRAKLERDAFENRLRSAIEEHLALLDLRLRERRELEDRTSPADEAENVRFLRRRTGA